MAGAGATTIALVARTYKINADEFCVQAVFLVPASTLVEAVCWWVGAGLNSLVWLMLRSTSCGSGGGGGDRG